MLKYSSHLIDLDSKDIAATGIAKSRGEVEVILNNLEKKGVVAKEKSGLFTTDKYVKLYNLNDLPSNVVSKRHREAFQDYAEEWIEEYDIRVQEVKNRAEKQIAEGSIEPLGYDSDMIGTEFYFAMHHLSRIHNEMDIETFVDELKKLEADTSGVFMFGIISQRFFFEDPTDVLDKFSDSILDIDNDVKSELFSGTLGVLFSFDIREFITELSKGWEGGISTDNFKTASPTKPDRVREKIQQGINSVFPDNIPPGIVTSMAHFITIIYSDPRRARENFSRFGKTAEKHGLGEDVFCEWLEEVDALIDELNPKIEESESNQADLQTEGFESLDTEVRSRIDLENHLVQNQSQAQQEFQQRLEEIRDRHDEITEQYIACGEALEEADNIIFPFIWYAVGHKVFSKVILGKENRDILTQYHQHLGARKQIEKENGNEIIITTNQVETFFDGTEE